MEKYSRYSFLPQHLEIHWFSIINSCVTVLLLTGFLATILMRVLKNDFIKYARDDETGEEQEETGWKYIHGDVFRFPRHANLFCAVIGTGTQPFYGLVCIRVGAGWRVLPVQSRRVVNRHDCIVRINQWDLWLRRFEHVPTNGR